MITLLSMLAFMLIPVWIPLITVSVGALSDFVRREPARKTTPERTTTAARATHLAKETS